MSWGEAKDRQKMRTAVRALCSSVNEEGPVKKVMGRMWVTQVKCQGTEERLLDCPYVGWGRRIRHMCPGQWRGVGVVCRPKLKRSIRPAADDAAVRRRTDNKALRKKKRMVDRLARRAARLARKKAAAARRRAAAALKRKAKAATSATSAAAATANKPVNKSAAAAAPPKKTVPRQAGGKTDASVATASRAEHPDAGRPGDDRNRDRKAKPKALLRPWAMFDAVDPARRRRRTTTTSTTTTTTATTTTTTTTVPTTSTTTTKRTTTTTPSPTTTTTTTPTTTTTVPTSTTTTPTTTTTTPTTTTTTPRTTTTTTPTTTTTLPTTTTTTPTTTTTSPTTTTTTPTTTTTTPSPTTTTTPTTTTATTTTTSTPPETTTTTEPTTTTAGATATTTRTTVNTMKPSEATTTTTTTTTPKDIAAQPDKPADKTVFDLSKVKPSGELTLKDKDLRSEDALLLQADSPANPELKIRLVGGRYHYEGRLEVREAKKESKPWGGICGHEWGMKETMVVCSELGLNYAKQPLKTNYFGGQNVTKVYHSFNCTGREERLSDCTVVRESQEHVCPKDTLVAGVICATYLPDLIPDLRRLSDSVRLMDRPLNYLQCALEENCLASSAYEIKATDKAWRNNQRRLLRFSTIVHNRGQADFRPYVSKAQWKWHACHMHYHSMEVFAHYDILDANGTRLAEGSKASFCLEDTTCDRGVKRKFQCAGFGDQGLSVNCSDNYLYDIDCQWIDITDIAPGSYTFLLEVNPSMSVAEETFDNNIARCGFYYSGYFAKFTNCVHESLLDYRR